MTEVSVIPVPGVPHGSQRSTSVGRGQAAGVVGERREPRSFLVEQQNRRAERDASGPSQGRVLVTTAGYGNPKANGRLLTVAICL